MSLKRSHTLYLQSKHRDTGTTSQYTINLPSFITNDANNEIFKVSLVSFTTYNDMLMVKDGKDTITKNGVDYVIPNGTYTYQNLSKALRSLLGVPVVWNTELNAIIFSFPTSTILKFDNIAYTLGFDAGVSYTGTTITSIRAMKPYEPTHIVVHLNNIQPVEEHLNLSNHTGEVRVANVLAKVLINASPFQLISYEQVLESNGLYSADNSLQVLEFLLTDNDGNQFVDLPEHELVLRIESIDVNDADTKDMIKELKEIRGTLKDLFMYKALRFRQ
jgi:hypothetical protein